VTRQNENSQRRLRSAILFLRLSLFPRRFFNRHLLQLRLQLVSILRQWEGCPSVYLRLKACPVDLRRQVEDLHRTTPVFRPPEYQPVAPLCLYHQLHPVYPRDHRNHRPATPTQPTSTLAVSDHRPDLPHRASQLLPRLVSQLLPKPHPLLLVLLRLGLCLLQASNRLLDSVDDCHILHTHHRAVFVHKIPSVSSRLDRVQD
jgi:hypothetical protein